MCQHNAPHISEPLIQRWLGENVRYGQV